MMRSQGYSADQGSATPDQLPVLDLYERYRDGEIFLTGAFGGVRIFVHPIKGAHPDDRSWRMYLAPRVQGLDRERTRPTAATRPAATGWQGVRQRQRAAGTLNETLAAMGMKAPFYSDDEDDR
jgi:hypothetical protein